MRRAVSNIAWTFEEASQAYACLEMAGIDGLEIAPGILFADCEDPLAPGARRAVSARRHLADFGLRPVSMQAPLFGVPDAHLFASVERRVLFRDAMLAAVRLSSDLDIGNIVLGAPKQRVRPEGMASADADALASEVIREVADEGAKNGVRIGVEVNPEAYGTNFLTTLGQLAGFLEGPADGAAAATLDLGAEILNDALETTPENVRRFETRLSHCHLSAPFLSGVPELMPEDLAPVWTALDEIGFEGWVSLEMRRPDGGLSGLPEAIARFKALTGGRCAQ